MRKVERAADFPMVTKWYETECPLLSPAARERLRESRARRDSRLRTLFGSAEAVAVAADGVREFADGLLFSQGRLGPHASTLREYTASLVNEIRSAPRVAQTLPSNPSLPWAQDPIALKAMEACEEVIAERNQVGDRWPYQCPAAAANLAWAPIVQKWEGYKAANKIESAHRECIPESVLRGLLASQLSIEPENVEREQIRQAGADLCCHYGPMVMLPLDSETSRTTEPAPEPKRDTRFWEEREDEFRKHDTPCNSKLSAVWFSLDGHWSFHGAPGKAASTSGAKQVFKSLARVAASGFAGARRAERWLAWLEALRCATDRSTGERLYSKVSLHGSHVLGESELERMASSGELIPAGGLVEFVVARQPEGDADGSTGHSLPSHVHAEMRKVWDTTTETIESLFVTSANFCLELRSRVSNPGPVTAAENLVGDSRESKELFGAERKDWEARLLEAPEARASLPTQPAESLQKEGNLPFQGASLSPEAASPTPSEEACDFISEAQRIEAVALYTSGYECSEASLARSAGVDRADMSKWKKGLLPAESVKKARIEKVLRDKKAPTPPPKRSRES